MPTLCQQLPHFCKCEPVLYVSNWILTLTRFSQVGVFSFHCFVLSFSSSSFWSLFCRLSQSWFNGESWESQSWLSLSWHDMIMLGNTFTISIPHDIIIDVCVKGSSDLLWLTSLFPQRANRRRTTKEDAAITILTQTSSRTSAMYKFLIDPYRDFVN